MRNRHKHFEVKFFKVYYLKLILNYFEVCLFVVNLPPFRDGWVDQGWTTLFGSRATLETKLVMRASIIDI